MKLQLALTLIWSSMTLIALSGGQDRTGQDKSAEERRVRERSRISRQWLPLVTRAAVALEIATALMNQPGQGKHMPDNIYFIFHYRGKKTRKKEIRTGR